MAVSNENGGAFPAWMFPAPARKSRFIAAKPEWAGLNIEVALGKIHPYEFAPRGESNVLRFDYQTQLDGTYQGRLGSGRGGVYQGYYLKGVGRTPAACNWNDVGERYHGSGHMSASSASRELLVTAWLRGRGLEHTIVPCETVLAASLSDSQRKAVANGGTSAHAGSLADSHLMTLSAKPANFARMSNIVWGLDHFGCYGEQIGALFLDFELQLRPPDARGQQAEGDPAGIAEAMEAAFIRGLDHFRLWARAGLLWLYTQNNFSLDGRFLDLETPLIVGSPMAGVLERGEGDQLERKEIGFEEFWFIWYWRLFLNWLKHKLRFLSGAELNLDRPVRLFLNEMRKQVSKQFAPDHHLYADRTLIDQAVRNLTKGYSTKGRRAMTAFAECCFQRIVNGRSLALPDLGWLEVTMDGNFPFGGPARVMAPAHVEVRQTEDALAFGNQVRVVGASTSPEELLRTLQNGASLFY